MQVRLTEEGLRVFGFSPDRKVANVSDDRAFALMSRGYAAQDKGFMAMFNGPLPEKKVEVKTAAPEPEKKEPELTSAEKCQKMIDEAMPEEPEKKIAKPKKERATSKAAKGRKKAVK